MLSRTIHEKENTPTTSGEKGVSMKTKEFKIKGHGKDQSQGNGKIENQYQSQKRQHKTLLLTLKLTRQNKTR